MSPANLTGIRARYLLNPSPDFELACRLRRHGAPLGELFSFISGLYFRGKFAYAQAFAFTGSGLPGSYVITSTAGLLPPDTVVTSEQLCEWATGDIDANDCRYRNALERACTSLSQSLTDSHEIILLGSIATPKYIDPLLNMFGEHLLFPAEFVGRGDLSRGGLMLRAVEAGKELVYTPVVNATRHGKKPPKLLPLVRRCVPPER